MTGIAVPEPHDLAELETPADAKELYDRLETLSQYAKRYGVDHKKQNEIAEAKLRTARKGGELLAADPSIGPGKGSTLKPLGFSKATSSRWQTLAGIPDEKWESSIAHAKETSNDELTLDRMVRIGREMKLGGRSEKREKHAREEAKKHGNAHDLSVADVSTWTPGIVDAIVTDPPYVGDSIPLYGFLRDFALRNLRPGGALVVMTWQGILPDVIRALDHPDLSYRWTLSWRYASANNSTVDHARRVFDRWKPVLLYHYGPMPADATMISDEITSEAPDKRHHEWGQSLEGFEHLVRAVAKPGELVCDPFLGGGTTALAALGQGRDFVGADIDPVHVETARARLA